jgi:hypothetical protein
LYVITVDSEENLDDVVVGEWKVDLDDEEGEIKRCCFTLLECKLLPTLPN